MKKSVFYRFLQVTFLLSLAIVVMVGCSSGGAPSGGTDGGADPAPGGEQSGGAGASGIEPMTLTAVTAWPENEINSIGLFIWADKVEELSNGAIKVEYKGGPEVIPSFDQGEAVRNGVVDIAFLATSYYSKAMPESLVFLYSTMSWDEMRSNGALDELNKIQEEKMGSHLVFGAPGSGYFLYTNQPINSIEDFKGKRIRGSGTYVPFIKALDAEPVNMPAGEIFEAMEKGVIDGYGYPIGPTDIGLEEVTKYKISNEFYAANRVGLINLEKWNSFSQEVKDIMIEAAKYTEGEVPKADLAKLDEEHAKLEEAGVQIVEVPEGEEYLKRAYDSGWEDYKKQTGENGELLEQFFRK